MGTDPVADQEDVDRQSTAALWSGLASWYDELIGNGSGPHETALETLTGLLPPLDGMEVLDVCCGQGLATRAVAAAGAAHVTGVDVASAMIDLARRRTHISAPVTYHVGDATRLEGIGNSCFDGVTCQLGLMDVGDLDAALAAVHRVLRPGGWLVAVIGHPCFLAPHARQLKVDDHLVVGIGTYFDEGFWRSTNPDGIRGRAGNYHRTLATYLNTLTTAGFALEQIVEPDASPLLAAQQPIYANVPIFFGFRAVWKQAN